MADVYLREPTRLSSQQVRVSELWLIIAADGTRKRDIVRLQTLVYTVKYTWIPFTPVLGDPVSALNTGVNGVHNVL